MLAARAGVSQRFLAQVEAGEANVSLLRLQEIAQALDLELVQLLASGAGSPGTPDPGHPVDLAPLLRDRSKSELEEVRDWLAARFSRPKGPLVALLGLRGAGKTTVGERLARRLRVPFFELDALIEGAVGLTLGQIFELQGDAFYRRLERETLARFLATTPAGVLATGGGIVNDPESFGLLRRRCTTVWLQARPELHWQRVVRQGDRRPMQGNPEAMQELRALLASRAPLYALADLSLDTSGRTPSAVAALLARQLAARAAT
jgi:XRE family aerobic/anaerobic benzoate catabolism transcriptional regulator